MYKTENDMTQEEKQLLLKDLCARLPYHVMVEYRGGANFDLTQYARSVKVENCKPYLRPMSSMTEEEAFNYSNLDLLDYSNDGFEMPNYRSIDWLNEHHFDYRGLIDKGLALEAPNRMYKTKQI